MTHMELQRMRTGFCAVLVAISLASCASIRTGSHFDETTNFDAYQTFTWISEDPFIPAPTTIVFSPLTHSKIQASTWSRPRIAVYFIAIGFGFLFLEIAFIQKFILYLGHPLYAAAAVLLIFLVFAGLGSQFAQRKRFHAIWPVIIILSLGVLELIALGMLFNMLSGLTAPMKFFGSVVMLGPLAFCMGMPFPLALTEIGADVPDLIPWAWGVNGFVSVVTPSSPVGRALQGARAGDSFEVVIRGRDREWTVVDLC